MSQLLHSYATDRYFLRLIQPDPDSSALLMVASSPSGETMQMLQDRAEYDEVVADCKLAEETYWQSMLSIALPEHKALFLSGWEHFRAYAGLPAPNPEEIKHDDDQQKDG
jgi:hypothetical protein